MLLSLEEFEVRAPRSLVLNQTLERSSLGYNSRSQRTDWALCREGALMFHKTLISESFVSLYSRNRYKDVQKYSGCDHHNNTYHE